MSETISKYKILNELKLSKDFIKSIKFLHVFKDHGYKSNVFIVTNDDKTYAFGGNSYGVLGFGHENEVNESIINEDLSNKQIIEFKNSWYHTVARTIDGKVYSWGLNKDGLLGNGIGDEKICKPELNKYLSDKHIIEICCGWRHLLTLTIDGQVYAWGCNWKGQIGNGHNDDVLIPCLVKGFNGEKVKAIACGYKHSMTLTENGNVYSWGHNYWGQLGFEKLNKDESINVPKLIEINQIFDKISCGAEHSLLLSHDGDIYVFGSNAFGQLGDEKIKVQIETPLKLKTKIKFIDIASDFRYSSSMALSEQQIIFIWGKFSKPGIFTWAKAGRVIKTPSETQFRSLDEVFAHYFQITSKTIQLKNMGNGRYNKEFIEYKFIASGSYGIVCAAKNKKNNLFYAIKKIPINKTICGRVTKEIEIPVSASSGKYVEREIDILRKLNSDLVVKLESIWIEDNYYELNGYKMYGYEQNFSSSHNVFEPNNTFLLHIQMELCSFTLKDVINKLNQELNQKANEILTALGYYISSELFIEILECVNFLHKQNIIHRDLKPTNILITNGLNGRFIKLADFGLAVAHDFISQSRTECVGTRNYMAPEVANGTKYDFKVDIYSLGIIIQELFKIDINEPIGENSNLELKYSKLFDLTERMTLTQRNKRPTCEQILNEKDNWALSLDELKNEQELESKTMNNCDEIFHSLFLKVKLKERSKNTIKS